MAFRKKASVILEHRPDILIIIECEHPEKILNAGDAQEPTDYLWFGKNQHKGLAIFSYGDYRFKMLDCHNENFKMIVPIQVTGGRFDFNLFMVWAYNPDDIEGRYVTQVWKAINFYDELLTERPTILIGDFNSNTIWDKKNRTDTHSGVVKLLADKGIFSAYHKHHKQKQGTEGHPTFYLYRHKDKPYHLDYCFVSKELLKKLKSVDVGEYEYWSKYSDHVPLIVDFRR